MGNGTSVGDFVPLFGGEESDDRRELGFLNGLGQFIAEDKGTAPVFLIKADYSRTVNIAVAGNSGVGKSLLVNTIRGVKPDDPTWAPVGVTETTQEPRWYEFPGETSVRLWDMEGAGGNCSWDDYTGNIGLRYFDVVLLLCSNRLTESDLTIMRELENQSIPFFFVRTKLDEDIRNNKADCNLTPQQTEESIRCDLQLGGITSPYLINARQPDKYDFPKLLKDIVIRLEIFERKAGGDSNGQPQAKAEVEVQPEATPEPVAPAPEVEKPAATAARPPAPPPAVRPPTKLLPSKAAEAPSAEANASPDAKAKRHFPDTASVPLIWSLPDGKHIEPIEALCANGGHWMHFEDEGFEEMNQAEYGQFGTFMTNKLLSNMEHTWSIRQDGSWECRVKNQMTALGAALTGKSYLEEVVDINEPDPPLKRKELGKRTLTARQRHLIEGGRLVSEMYGKAMSHQDGNDEPFHSRMHRFVVDDQYWQVIEVVTDGKYCVRRFKRYPFFRIMNETGKTLTVKTYAVSALFGAPNTTTTLEPGTSYVDCYRADTTMEQVIFTLPNRTSYTISQAEPFETYCIRTELFS